MTHVSSNLTNVLSSNIIVKTLKQFVARGGASLHPGDAAELPQHFNLLL